MQPNDRQQADIQNIHIVLNQYGERQKDQLNKTEILLTLQGQILEKLTGIEARLVEITATPSKIDPGPFRALLHETVGTISQKFARAGACGARKFHVQLFPEREAGQYIRAVFVRCGMWLVILAGLFYLYKLGIRWMDQHYTIQVKTIENQNGEKAWQYLYRQSDKRLKKRMDSILLKVAMPATRDNLNGTIPARTRANFKRRP